MDCGLNLKSWGLVPETTYLYMQGHHVMDNVVMKLLIPVCTVLRREREQEIKRLVEHNEQVQKRTDLLSEQPGERRNHAQEECSLQKDSSIMIGYGRISVNIWKKERIKRKKKQRS